jgi:hypothetical protein
MRRDAAPPGPGRVAPFCRASAHTTSVDGRGLIVAFSEENHVEASPTRCRVARVQASLLVHHLQVVRTALTCCKRMRRSGSDGEPPFSLSLSLSAPSLWVRSPVRCIFTSNLAYLRPVVKVMVSGFLIATSLVVIPGKHSLVDISCL